MTDPEKIFAGKKALIVGGTGGIGREIAIALAKENAEVTVHGGSSEERLKKTISRLKEAGCPDAKGFLHLIEGPSSAEIILKQSPNPDILICAWGPFERTALENTGASSWEKMALYNLAFPGALVSLVIQGMMERNYGRILLFGGTNTDTIRGFTTTAAYSAPKTAVGVIAKSAAKICGSKNVNCNVICPGLTDTEYLDENAKSYNSERSPGKKPINAEKIARLAVTVLANPEINGAIIPIDRGIVL